MYLDAVNEAFRVHLFYVGSVHLCCVVLWCRVMLAHIRFSHARRLGSRMMLGYVEKFFITELPTSRNVPVCPSVRPSERFSWQEMATSPVLLLSGDKQWSNMTSHHVTTSHVSLRDTSTRRHLTHGAPHVTLSRDIPASQRRGWAVHLYTALPTLRRLSAKEQITERVSPAFLNMSVTINKLLAPHTYSV